MKPIPGYADYHADEAGNVFSTKRSGPPTPVTIVRKDGAVPTCQVRRTGEAKAAVTLVNHLVCAAHHGPRPSETHTVLHWNEDLTDCRAENLAWISTEEPWETAEGVAPVPGYPGYFVDEDSVVYSTVSGSLREGSVFRLTPSRDLVDYWCVTLRKNGQQKRRRIHVLACLAFHGEKSDPTLMARHLDDNKDNNHISNLAWGTAQDNADDRERNGRTYRKS